MFFSEEKNILTQKPASAIERKGLAVMVRADAMTGTAMPSSDTDPLCLPPLLDLTRADALHGALQLLLARDGSVRVDGSPVERVSTACVQLLVAAAMAARSRGRAFELMAPSDVLGHAVRDLGLCAVLGLGLGQEAA